ncbi:MAG TPA: GatB/YqeY domain-containing protein [Patescibacteria group bacterium]|nr:GatB/YqeY domain-containing protein [Patescibacteria group bacterium]
MSLKDRLMEDMKLAMKEKEEGKQRLSVIRMVRASIKNVEIDRKCELSEDEVLDVLAREVKLRRDAMEEFRKGNRPDLVENLERELVVLMQYLPQQLTEEEIRKLVTEAVHEAQAVTPKDMGKVMAVLMPKVKGRSDGKLVNSLVREALSANP